MFEKEAEEYLKKDGTKAEQILSLMQGKIKVKIKQIPFILAAFQQTYQDGAELGYNKAKEDADKMKSQFLELCNLKDMRIAELEKANEWHYMKDVNCYEDLHFPPEEEEKGRVLVWKVQVITEKGIKKPVCYHCGSYGDLWYEMNAYHVIAWKEIVLPELKEINK